MFVKSLSQYLSARHKLQLVSVPAVAATIRASISSSSSSSAADKKQNNNDDFEDFDDTDGSSSTSGASKFLSTVPEVEESIEREADFRAYVEQMRNVSRFSKPSVQRKYYGAALNDETGLYDIQAPVTKLKSDQNVFRRALAKYGKASGVEPGVAWPHLDELNKIIEEEKTCELTLEQKVNTLIERKLERKQAYLQIEKETDEALTRMPKTIDAFYQRIQKKQATEKEQMRKKQDVLEQAREYYGYSVNLGDPRVKEMVHKLQEEKKAAEKAQKKELEKKRKQGLLVQTLGAGSEEAKGGDKQKKANKPQAQPKQPEETE